jgi:hypothetical protein
MSNTPVEENAPGFDTRPWRAGRNIRLMGWIGDVSAVEYLLMIGESSEFFDDLIDKDKPLSDDQIIRMMFTLLLDLQTNSFFQRHKTELLPLMSISMNAWLDANTLERQEGNGANRAYVLRDLTIEIAIHVIGMVRGRAYMREVSASVREFFLHETLEEYKGKLT